MQAHSQSYNQQETATNVSCAMVRLRRLTSSTEEKSCHQDF
jgi:hypothetical protein